MSNSRFFSVTIPKIKRSFGISERQVLKIEKILPARGVATQSSCQDRKGGSAKALNYSLSVTPPPSAARLKPGIFPIGNNSTENCISPITDTLLKDTLEKLPLWPNSRIDKRFPLNPAFIETVNHKKL